MVLFIFLSAINLFDCHHSLLSSFTFAVHIYTQDKWNNKHKTTWTNIKTLQKLRRKAILYPPFTIAQFLSRPLRNGWLKTHLFQCYNYGQQKCVRFGVSCILGRNVKCSVFVIIIIIIIIYVYSILIELASMQYYLYNVVYVFMFIEHTNIQYHLCMLYICVYVCRTYKHMTLSVSVYLLICLYVCRRAVS